MTTPRSRTRIFALLCASWVGAAIAPADDFPPPRDTEPAPGPAMPAEQAAKAFQVPEGFRVSLFAAEPDVRNPIAMTWDARGRLWVAENYTYAERAARFDLRHRDRRRSVRAGRAGVAHRPRPGTPRPATAARPAG